ncbi:MAG: class I adenylate-forming enzyme family protein [Alphaproteobacteria bacterium]|jgi:acyl-CoA synthetase (AMP-forming)/AMP-acid ligase II|nr:class I adenylate-forming enzyme family protein [Alphaproteobacteria bacterium]
MGQFFNLGDLVGRDRDPAALALVDLLEPERPRRFSHGEVDAEARAVARGLLRRGLKRGQRVAILSANRAEFLTAYFGTMRAGLVSVPVSYRFPSETIRYILGDADVAMVFADTARLADCPDDIPVVCFDGAGEDGFGALLDPGDFESVRPDEDEIAMFLYTSGSTGVPKGVPLSHAGQLWVIAARAQVDPDYSRHRFLVAAPLYHMNALIFTKLVMASHASMVLLPEFRAPAYIEAIERHRCTWLTSVPTMLALVARETELLGRTDLSSVEVVGMGSAPLTQHLVDALKAVLPGRIQSNSYGTTEAGAGVFGPHPDGLPRPDLSLGYPLAGIGIRLVDDAGREAAEGVLQLDTPAMMPGYHNLPDKTAERITADGWYDTGDVMRRDDDGWYYFVGRADDMFNCGGENLYPGEVEKMLERHDDIDQACVVPVADEIKGAKPVAFIVARAGAELREETVKAFALAHAPAFQHPRRVFFLDALPLAATNKIDRTALTERAAAETGGQV